MEEYKRGMYAIRPLSDFLAFRAAHRKGELRWGEWLRSVMHRQHFLYFRLSDPMPSLVRVYPFIRNQVRKVAARMVRRTAERVTVSRSVPTEP
jgi:hypothetical protein